MQIRCGDSRGSGFHLFRTDLVVTNHHVVGPMAQVRNAVSARTEKGAEMALEYVAHSDPAEHDYAIYRLMNDAPGDRIALVPAGDAVRPRGCKVLFAGFPHGVEDLLAQQATVAGPLENGGFYMDGSINGGNSGGPILDLETGEVVGIVTQRRFLFAPELAQMAKQARELEDYCNGIAKQGSVVLMGMDFSQVIRMIAASNQLIRRVIEVNANSGIGIGYSIRHVVDRLAGLGLAT